MLQLQIEPTTRCNARCLFCPHSRLTRQQGTMDMALYRTIIDDAATIPAIESLCLTGLGEPLLDPTLLDKVRYADERMPGRRIDVFTNGHLLDKRMARALKKAGVDILYVSLNALDREKRRAIMGLDDLPQVEQAIEDAAGIGLECVVSAVTEKDLFEPGEREEFIERWGGLYGHGGRAFLHMEGNWAGILRHVRTRARRACMRAFSQVMVLWDGRVSLCCFDAEGAVILGDLRTQTIREVYNGPRALSYRQAHHEGRRGELELCRDCTDI